MSSDTHFACPKRLAVEGGQARCCECVPHEGCELIGLNQHKPEISGLLFTIKQFAYKHRNALKMLAKNT